MSKYASTDPTTGTVVAKFETLSDEQALSSLSAADMGYRTWRNTEMATRTAVLQRVADLHRERETELAELMTLEMGKPIAQARGEVKLSASIFEYYATKGQDLLADEELDIAGSGRALVRTAPIGALVGVMPWNFPYYQVARFVAPNLLLGNTILLKHASNCPQQALAIEAMLRDAGSPEGVYQNIFASSDQIADMIADPRIQGVSLTGSERAGSIIGQLAGKYMKKAVLELGGSDPLLVLAGANVADAVAAAVPGRFGNAGQACTSSKRMIVDAAVWDEFLDGFVSAAGSWTMGDPTDPATRLGPMSSTDGRDEIAEQVADAVAKGATLHLGGTIPDGEGAYYPATVLSDVTPDMRAYREELFGPVAVLHKVDSTDAAIDLANDSPFGLGSAVFTTDDAEAAYVADRLDVGMVGINTTIKSAPDMPFGGVKTSGIGRELGRFGLDEFANKKLVRTL